MLSNIISTIMLIQLFFRKIRDDYVTAFSAQAALFIIISFFPFIMLLLSIIQFLPVDKSELLYTFNNIFPSSFNSIIISIVTEIFNKASSTIVSITAITALWSAGKGILAIQRGLNSVYGIKETRNYFYLRFTAAFYTLVFAVMFIITIILFVFGNSIYIWIERKLPFLSNFVFLIISLRTILGLIILTFFFLMIYVAVPNRKSKSSKELPGAILTAAGWIGFSYIYSYYIDNFSNYQSMYGSLTTIVFFLLWMYFCMYILFVGAELNAILSNSLIMNEIKMLYKKEKD
ncbi:MAG TPA: YihY/virulence factor BrkB family protein [Clostridiales bacterium]|nr:YihY/virulence factor BrkB family protein [Clostridiales bacterium]